MSEDATTAVVVRHFRQCLLWPLALLPPPGTSTVRRHWEALEALAATGPWKAAPGAFRGGLSAFRESDYREFVTFLPYVRRFLYGSKVGVDTARHEDAPSVRVYTRDDIARVRITFPDAAVQTFDVAHVALYFFVDADVALHALEIHADDLPLERAQETMFRFGRAYPTFWDEDGGGANCARLVELLDARGTVVAESDYDNRGAYLDHVSQQRTPRLASHWQYLLRPLSANDFEDNVALRFRPLEHYRMPFTAYLAVDDPRALTRMDFVRIALARQPGPRDAAPYSEQSLETFEHDYCEDRYWVGAEGASAMRILATGRVLALIGRHGDRVFGGAETGALGQYRHQYFLLFLIVLFHRSALLSMSNKLAIAMSRLDVGDTDSVKRFKRAIRQGMEVFLRFTHRYWYHQVSQQDLVRRLFKRMSDHLGSDELYNEVRQEMMDMSSYLDSDSLRRQASTILRLTVVTIMAMMGTIATGFLGMNLIAAADRPLWWRAGLFVIVVGLTAGLTLVTVSKSKRLANVLDAMSDERLGWRGKWRVLRDVWRGSV